MHKRGIAIAIVVALSVVGLIAILGVNMVERSLPAVAAVDDGSNLALERIALERERLEFESLRLKAQIQAGLESVATELIHQEVKPHDPRKEDAIVDAIVAYVDEKEGAKLVEPEVVMPIAPPALGDFEPDEQAYGDFRGALEPYGDWYETPDYGPIWRPDSSYIEEGWQPYTNGSWDYTDYGWTWASRDPFGWACDHYGRWLNVRQQGWCWVPGREWASAWVSWRSNGKHIGWVPLPPCATWNQSLGIGGWVDAHCGIGPGHYHFVTHADFGALDCRKVIVHRSNNVSLVASSKNITHLHSNGGVVHNHGPDFVIADRRSSDRIHKRPLDLAEEKAAVKRRIAGAKRRESTSRHLSAAAVDRGWSLVKSRNQQRTLRKQMVEEARGSIGGAGRRNVKVMAGTSRQVRFAGVGGLPRPAPIPVQVLQKRSGAAKSGAQIVAAEAQPEPTPTTGSDHFDAEQARRDAAIAKQNEMFAQRQQLIDDRLAKEAEARGRLEAHIRVRQDRIAKADREIAVQKQRIAERRQTSSPVVVSRASSGGGSSSGSSARQSPSLSNSRPSSSSSDSQSEQSSLSQIKHRQQTVVSRPAKQKRPAAQSKPAPAPKPAAAAPARSKQTATVPSGSKRGSSQKRKDH